MSFTERLTEKLPSLIRFAPAIPPPRSVYRSELQPVPLPRDAERRAVENLLAEPVRGAARGADRDAARALEARREVRGQRDRRVRREAEHRVREFRVALEPDPAVRERLQQDADPARSEAEVVLGVGVDLEVEAARREDDAARIED